MRGFQVLNDDIHHSFKLQVIIAKGAIAGSDSIYEAEFTKQFMKRKGQPFFKKGFDIFSGRDTIKYSLAEGRKILRLFYFQNQKKN